MSAQRAETNGGRLYGAPAVYTLTDDLPDAQDVREKTFTALDRKGGLHPEEVDAYLHRVALALERAARQVERALDARDTHARRAEQYKEEMQAAFGDLDRADAILADLRRDPTEGVNILANAQRVANETIQAAYERARDTDLRTEENRKAVIREAIERGEQILAEAEQAARLRAEEAAAAAEAEYDRTHAAADRVAADRDRAAQRARLESTVISMDALEQILDATLNNFRAQTAVVKIELNELAGTPAALPAGTTT